MDPIKIKAEIFKNKMIKIFQQVKWVKNNLRKKGINVDGTSGECCYGRTVCITEIKEYGNCNLALIKCCDRCSGYNKLGDIKNIEEVERLSFKCMFSSISVPSVNRILIIPKIVELSSIPNFIGKYYIIRNNFYESNIPNAIKKQIPEIKIKKVKNLNV